ncbi:MAG: hypothetical protein JNJ48_01580, partial [Phycisphaerae bacterium]|nr:hypothetical protein [Phycisphaerae bacterium]
MARCVVFAGIAGALTWLSGLASAQPVLITTPTTVGPADSTILGVPLATAQITVQGATLTMSGRHTVASLTLERNPGGQAAVLTHPNAATYDYSGGAGTDVVIGLWLTVTGSVSIQGASGGLPACGIDLTGRGHGPEVGPGAGTLSGGTAAGGAHGGGGGRSSVGALGGQSYGSFLEPSSFGSGGGRDADCCGYRTPGSGGGALRLIVQGTLSVDGFVSADGTAAAVGESGGGAGGGVWITAGQLVGAGRIAARGGNGWPSAGGGGGGGRVSATYTASTYAGTWDVSGGTGAQSGGAGTVFTKSTGASLGLLAIDNGSTPPGATTEFSGTVAIPASLRVGPGAIVGPRIGEAGLRLQVQGDATVENGGAVSASFRGFAAEAGDAPGQTSGGSAAGGGHGGAGGNSSVGALGGGTYGSVQFPVTMGSGGGRDTDCCGARTPGRGGGAVWLEVGGALVVQGEISAHGEAAPVGESGGGAGGSVYITAASLGGTGTIAADGGAGAPAAGGGGGGGGGRVAVYTQTFGFNGVARAVGGNGFVRGGAGTVYVRPGVASLATLTVDNGGVAGATTEFTGDVSLPASLVVGPGGIVGPPVGVSGLHLQFAGDVTVQVGGAISADARGFAPESGPAPGASSGGSAAGGGHGGAGGNSSVGALGGGTYGSVVAPVTLGSGGGRDTDCCGYRAPGRGGGAIRLTASGTVTIEGRASVEGGDAPVVESGGGAGGSLWITCGALAGAGVISADGGDGAPVTQGGGGGGGRIAVQYGSSSFTGVMTSTGGAGFVKGGAGTVYTVQTGQPLGTVTVANGGVFGATTEFAGAVTLAANLVVGPGAIVGPPVGDPSLVMNLGGGVTVQAGGRIGADARGYAPEAGPTPGSNSGGAAGGGGHGGAGGASSFGASGGGCYGDVFSPTAMGSGGGRDTDCCGYRTPGRGGGVIKIV